VATLLAYGAYLPRYRIPVKELHGFYGRPGRPRSRTLATPGLDEDPITMAYEAGRQALAGGETPKAVLTVSQAPPFGLRKMSGTLANALSLDGVVPLDVGGHPRGLLDAIGVAGLMAEAGVGPVLVVATDHLVAYEDKVADMLSAGGAAAFLVGADGGFANLGPEARSYDEVFDVWRLGTEPEARYRLEVLFGAYGNAAKGALADLEKATGKLTDSYDAVAASQPHPNAVRGLGRLGVTKEQQQATSFVGEIGNIGAASVGFALALALDAAEAGQSILVFGYGSGEGIAQAIDVTAAPPAIGAAEQIAGVDIDLSTYYRWTRGRQQEPH
jgi:hydroxymethylglutaryl-CoA synthase